MPVVLEMLLADEDDEVAEVAEDAVALSGISILGLR
jgi:hypothetical protein